VRHGAPESSNPVSVTTLSNGCGAVRPASPVAAGAAKRVAPPVAAVGVSPAIPPTEATIPARLAITNTSPTCRTESTTVSR
jgi:hypothetical protein